MKMRALLLSAAIALLSMIGFGAQTTLFNMPQQPVGPVTNLKAPSSGFAVPVGTSAITIATNIQASDLADATKSLTIAMESSSDGGTTWNFESSFTWQGGENNPKTGLPDTSSPIMTFDVSRLGGRLVRASITLPKVLTTGVIVTAQ
jgi:hypothetical protein